MVLVFFYVVGMYMTNFYVENEKLVIKNVVARRYNNTIDLADIKWIMVADANMCIKLKDGRAVVVRYVLSPGELQEFSNAFGSIGIPCIC